MQGQPDNRREVLALLKCAQKAAVNERCSKASFTPPRYNRRAETSRKNASHQIAAVRTQHLPGHIGGIV